MRRRPLLQAAASLAAGIGFSRLGDAFATDITGPGSRVRPGDSGWPSDARWAQLSAQVGGRLVKVASPMDTCRAAPRRPAPPVPRSSSR